MGHSDGRTTRSVCRNIQEPLVIASSRVFRFVDPLSKVDLGNWASGERATKSNFLHVCFLPTIKCACINFCMQAGNWDFLRMSLQWPLSCQEESLHPMHAWYHLCVDGTVISSSSNLIPQSCFFPITTIYVQNHNFVYLVLFPVMHAAGQGPGNKVIATCWIAVSQDLARLHACLELRVH